MNRNRRSTNQLSRGQRQEKTDVERIERAYQRNLQELREMSLQNHQIIQKMEKKFQEMQD